MNPYCATCLNAHNGINGRYCNKNRRYVEHDKAPVCDHGPLTIKD